MNDDLQEKQGDAPARSSSSSGDPSLDIPDGTLAGEYVIHELIGAGAFGAVYRGEHPVIGKTVAIKILKREVSRDPSVVSRFVAEARAVGISGVLLWLLETPEAPVAPVLGAGQIGVAGTF